MEVLHTHTYIHVYTYTYIYREREISVVLDSPDRYTHTRECPEKTDMPYMLNHTRQTLDPEPQTLSREQRTSRT